MEDEDLEDKQKYDIIKMLHGMQEVIMMMLTGPIRIDQYTSNVDCMFAFMLIKEVNHELQTIEWI